MATPSPAERQELTDIGRRLDHLPIGPMHRKVVVAIGLGLFFEVYEITGYIATFTRTGQRPAAAPSCCSLRNASAPKTTARYASPTS